VGHLSIAETIVLNFVTLCRLSEFTSADLGFYKDVCPIHLKGALEIEGRRSNIFRPPANYSDPYVTGTKQFLALEEIVGARQSYLYIKSNTKFL